MTNKFLILGKRLGAVALGAALLCVSMQGATLKEIEAEKKAQKETQQKLGKYEVVLTLQDNTITELKKSIPAQKKDLLMKAIYYANIASDKYTQETMGHMFAENISNSGFTCEYIIESTYESGMTEKDAKNSSYFKEEYGYADSCLLDIVWSLSWKEYAGIADKKYYSKTGLAFYDEKKHKNKKAFVKWLNDIKFYDYIGKLELKDSDKTNWAIQKIKEIKESLRFDK
ncbi:hypothetical protein [Helicobacter trogontum]|uniref:hypothetical protein n=1 Tax=Helicobacter trogontum TaxID=50960 RepID=UPI000CF1B347|nr:hypothetical protein [Helicobacter trogontum]